jgi:hypothetical protein
MSVDNVNARLATSVVDGSVTFCHVGPQRRTADRHQGGLRQDEDLRLEGHHHIWSTATPGSMPTLLTARHSMDARSV